MPNHVRWLVAGALSVYVLAYSVIYICVSQFVEDTEP